MGNIKRKQELAEYIERTTGYFKTLTDEQVKDLHKMLVKEKSPSKIRNKTREFKKINNE